ncbi:hypothetical protein QYF36_006018 [Acer negundo]|nr:hypothetical protein QYF36_006018 [Acer negundo]
MHELLGLESVPGEKFRQEVLIPWGEEEREIRNDAELLDVLGEFEQRNVSQIHFNVNYIPPAVMSYYQSSNSEGEESDNENNENGDEMHNANNDNEDENDSLSDVNEDGISQEVVVDIGSDSDSDIQRDPPNRGTAFRVGVDGRITIEVGQMFRGGSHFREIIKDYSIQEGFKLKIIRNERNRITYKCEAESCPWRVHGSPTFDRVTYMLKTLKNMHTCLSVTKNRDANSVWLGKKFEAFIKENPNKNIKVLGSVALKQCGITVPDHTLYRAKRYALNIRDRDHKQSYNKLYKYGHIIMEKNLGSCVKLMTIRHNPNPQIPASFQRFKVDYLTEQFWPAANSSNLPEFLKAMDAIKATSEAAYLYLTQIPLESWTFHKFDTICKTDHITNSIVEAFNSWLNKFRTLPMLTLMERTASTAPSMPQKVPKSKINENGTSSTHYGLDSIHVGPAAVTSRNAGAVSEHGGNASSNSGPGTTIGLGGPSTCASGTITRRKEQEKLASAEARARVADAAQKRQVQFENSAAERAARA